MRFKLEVVINLEHYDVDSLLGEVLKLLAQNIEITIAVVVEQV
jgi:hypothetical protein